MARRSTTLDEVAAVAEVSRMTASRALNDRPGVSEDLRQRIRTIARELGYVPNHAAQRLASNASRALGILCCDIHGPFVSQVIFGAMQAARSAGYEVLLYSLLDPDEELREEVARILSQSTQGVVSLILHRRDYLTALTAAHLPVITIESPERTACNIVSDSANGARAAMRHLFELGHRRIAHLAGHEQIPSSKERLRAYEECLLDRGLPRDRALIERGDNTHASGVAAMARLLALPDPPTAVFAVNDSAALGAIEAARAAGLRVPEDLSVVGFDDVPQAATARPPLTTVRQPMEQMGRSAVNTLLAQLVGLEPASPVITFPTELVVRASTAAPARRRAVLHRAARAPRAGVNAHAADAAR